MSCTEKCVVLTGGLEVSFSIYNHISVRSSFYPAQGQHFGDKVVLVLI